jgi:hypothetical protein
MLKVARIFRWAGALGTAALLVWSLEGTSLALDPGPVKEPSSARSARKTSINPFFVMGGAVRIDDAPLFNITQRVGGNFGIGFAYQMQPFSIGLSYEYTGLGREDSGVGPYGFVHIDRSLDTIWASVKARFNGPTWVTPVFGVALGATWQDATLNGVVLLDGGARGAATLGCSVKDSANLAFRAGGGFEFPLGSSVSFITDASFDAYRLSSDIIEFCSPGAGSTSAFLLRVGLTYRYDLSESRSATRKPTARR